jgi:hypothetical protein
LLGQTYPETGMREGLAAIRVIANHPSTARHVARNWRCISSPISRRRSAVDRLARVFRETGGDLQAVTSLIDLPEAWQRLSEEGQDAVGSRRLGLGRDRRSLPPDQAGARSTSWARDCTWRRARPAGPMMRRPGSGRGRAAPGRMVPRPSPSRPAALDPVALSAAVLGDTIDPRQRARPSPAPKPPDRARHAAGQPRLPTPVIAMMSS